MAEAAGLLSRVLAQDIERPEDGPELRQGVARDRMPSVHDPEMRHGRKSKAQRFDGHKAQVVVDTESQLITAVATLSGNAADHEQALAMVEATKAATGVGVEETIADCAYGDGATRLAFAEAKRSLVAKVPAMTNQGCFPKTAFIIALAAGSCSCPAAQVSTDLRPRGAGGGVFRFPAAVCAGCPLRAQCVRGRRGTDSPGPSPRRPATSDPAPPGQSCLRRVPSAAAGGGTPARPAGAIGDSASPLLWQSQDPVPTRHGSGGCESHVAGGESRLGR